VFGDAEENDVDVFVSNVLDQEAWPWPVDLMHGVAGLGTFCLARLPSSRAGADLTRVVAHLASVAVEDADGLAWPYVPPPGATHAFNEHRPAGNVNLGFPHGMAGIVAFLASAVDADVPGARDLLAPGVRWLLAQRLQGPTFPKFVAVGRRPTPARLAWCYGAPGAATALLAAGRALGDDEVVAAARDVALGCAGRDDGVEGATLCHGTAGLGHLFNRLGQALGEERLLDLARHWFTVTLDRYLDDLTVVDRATTKQRLEAGGTATVDPGFGLLFGAAGVALALLSATTDEEPWWDGVLFARGVPAGVTSVKHERHGGVTPPR
jgi:lantibiotic modifying enzyme